MLTEEQTAHLDTMEDALGKPIEDREAFMAAFRGLMSCCDDEGESEDGEENEGEQKGKGLPTVAIMLGKKGK
jgi:hypothetical protein